MEGNPTPTARNQSEGGEGEEQPNPSPMDSTATASTGATREEAGGVDGAPKEDADLLQPPTTTAVNRHPNPAAPRSLGEETPNLLAAPPICESRTDRCLQHVVSLEGPQQSEVAPATNLGGQPDRQLLGNTRSVIVRRRGKRPRSGSHYRIAPDEETAVEAAIRTAEARKGEPIFYPYQGTVFNSKEEAWHFYNLYSWEMGFGIRIRDTRSNHENYLTKQDLVCCCQGRDRNPNSASARTNCKAMIRLLRRGDNSWYIKTVVDTHNHRLTESFGENEQWGSHGKMDTATQELVRKLKENNVSLGRICNILGVTTRASIPGVRKQTVRSYCAKLSRKNMDDDIGKTLNLLNEMKRTDPGLEVRFRIDNKRTLKSVLWCTGKNRADYAQFGDAITFDTTYRTNLYSLPFGLFVGVNNHFQTTIFGGVLLTSEKTEDFEWAFTTFVDIMGGKAPTTMLTDQCAAMAAAMKTSMRNTKHRWCRWHVLKDAKSNVGEAYSKESMFKTEFNDLVTFETNQQNFVRRFKLLQERYKLTENSYLNRLFKHREWWAKPYFMGIFCAGMTSTQRSESANHMLKSIMQKAAPMHLFVSKFNELQSDRNKQESTASFGTNQRSRSLRTKYPLEEHANAVYTKSVYEIFTYQLHRSRSYIVKSKPSANTYILVHSKYEDSENPIYMTVRVHGNESIKCTCALFEHLGVLCRHAIKVLLHLDRKEIPRSNILARWTKSLDSNASASEYIAQLTLHNEDLKKRMLIEAALQLAGSKTSIPTQKYRDTLQSILAATAPQHNQTTTHPAENYLDVRSQDQLPTSCPPSTYKGGRPAHSSLKSWQLSVKKQKKQKKEKHEKQKIVEHDDTDTAEEDNTRPRKKRSIVDLNSH